MINNKNRVINQILKKKSKLNLNYVEVELRDRIIS